MKFAAGSLVQARGREWVVLPDDGADPDLLLLRPLGGTDDEITGIYRGPGPDGRPFEAVTPAEFPLPDPAADLGNHLSCGLLRDAVRLGFRSAAGPFRALARIAVEPRPYQLVPLLLALRLDPVRLFIADDVGIGKTIEACLIARELLDRGEVERLAVLCPPHLAEQWQRALRDQFHLDAALVLSGTAARLERALPPHQTLFERHPVTVVSTDFIKQERRRLEFLRTCPELVIVDEAHSCADAGGRSAAQQRYALLREIARDPARHLVLVSATPHSGDPETFRSLLALLDESFRELPEELGGEVNRKHREKLARHLVQRRRGDIRAYLDTITPFPTRDIAEESYALRPAYRKFFDRILDYCRETVLDPTADRRRQRVRWWSALALLRALSSSPAAAAATLRNRSATADAETLEQVDEQGRRAVLDLDDESAEGIDVVPGAGEEEGEGSSERRRLLDLARDADALSGKDDAKLARAVELIQALVAEGRAPIVFCRFIPTVEYVAAALRGKLPKDVTVEPITGMLPAEERESRVEDLARCPRRVLVCTDCLSEGVNLQHAFDTVIHYDLSWNPTRHEQREGRVDRYGQEKDVVRAVTYYGRDNPVDGIVLEVLLRKHRRIRDQLGVAVPIPMDTEVVEEAIQEGLLLRKARAGGQLTFEFMGPKQKQFGFLWDAAAEREKKSRAIFAQHALLGAVNEDIFRELAEVRRAIGADADVERFATLALRASGAVIDGGPIYTIDVRECPAALRDAIREEQRLRVVFRGQPKDGAVLLTRTHPVVEGLAAHLLETALDPRLPSPARRCGVVRTRSVDKRTALILVRLRFHLVTRDRRGDQRKLLAEDLALFGFTGSPEHPTWLDPAEPELLEPLVHAEPHANIAEDLARHHLGDVLAGWPKLTPKLHEFARDRGDRLLAAHRRVRKVIGKGGPQTLGVEASDALDALGVFIYLPVDGGAA